MLSRSLVVSMVRFFVLFLVAAMVAGCGGIGPNFVGEISGVVFDANGDIVREARVFFQGKETFSNSSGIYVLQDVGEGQVAVRADVVRNGVTFSGVNVFQVFRSERTKNANIVVVRQSQQASIHGTVRDRFGNRVAGARVFAVGNALTSNVDITDGFGDYALDRLQSGISYLVTATARTYNSDTATVLLVSGEDRQLNLILDDETNPTLPAPQNVVAVAWTTPFEATRAPNKAAAFEAIKRLIDPRRAQRHSGRDTPAGNHVEVDVYWGWAATQFDDALLGFGIYRATSALGPATAVDFVNDPNALFFADIDQGLFVNQVYYYEVTALNTSYPDFPNSESPPSNRFDVLTLGDLFLLGTTNGPLTFHWQAAQNADEYSVFLFDELPSIGVNAFWDTGLSPTTGTSQVYTGPVLQSGHRYFYIVLGTANLGDSRTLSAIGEFVAN